MLIWITGISGAGKTTIASNLYKYLQKKYSNLIYLDGDQFRKIMGNDLEYTLADRDRNAERMTRLCQHICSQGIHIICGANLTTQQYRDWCRREIPGFFEVFIYVPMEILLKRDIKKLYKRALSGEISNVVGLDIPFVPPASPDLVIDNSKDIEDFDDIIKIIIEKSGM